MSRFLVYYDIEIVYAEPYGIYGTQYKLYKSKYDSHSFKVVSEAEIAYCKSDVKFSTFELETVPMHKYLGLLERVEALEKRC